MQRTHRVGVLVHDLRDEFYARILRGIEDVAFANDFSVVVCETDRDPDKEIVYVRRLRSQRADAVIYAGSSAADAEKQEQIVEQLRRLENAGAVLLRLAPHATVEPDVSYSTREGFGLLVDHLADLGHTEFAYVGAPVALNSTKVARHALAEALFRHGIEFRAERMLPGDGTRAAGEEAAKQLVEQGLPVTAVLAATDHAAAGLLEGFAAHGVDVPAEVSVVGFGDLTLAHDRSLTTVRVPLTELGDTAMKRCIWYLGGGARAGRDNLPLELVVRGSCGPARPLP
jgi:LacI family transcriptional regulator